jgi:hypothetical protein
VVRQVAIYAIDATAPTVGALDGPQRWLAHSQPLGPTHGPTSPWVGLAGAPQQRSSLRVRAFVSASEDGTAAAARGPGDRLRRSASARPTDVTRRNATIMRPLARSVFGCILGMDTAHPRG